MKQQDFEVNERKRLFIILGDSSEVLQFPHPISPIRSASLNWQQQRINPLTHMSDQDRISPYNIKTISSIRSTLNWQQKHIKLKGTLTSKDQSLIWLGWSYKVLLSQLSFQPRKCNLKFEKMLAFFADRGFVISPFTGMSSLYYDLLL